MDSEFIQSSRNLAASIEAFHSRFQVSDDNLPRRFALLLEEVHEHYSELGDPIKLQCALEEMADIAYIALGTLELYRARGRLAMNTVTTKNNRKTLRTHRKNQLTGKIERREAN